MNDDIRPTDDLDAIIADLHDELEDGASADRVLEIADRHPGSRAEILAFAAEWFATDGSDLPDDDLSPGRTAAGHAALLERLREAVAPPAQGPFAGASHEELGRIADRCRIDMAILRQLVRGFVDVATIPVKLIAWLADASGTETRAVLSHLSSAPAARADYFAPDGRRDPGRTSFADAVRSSTLSDEDKRFWLRHLDG